MYNFLLNHFWNAPKIAKTFCLKFAVQRYMSSSVTMTKFNFLLKCIVEGYVDKSFEGKVTKFDFQMKI